MLTARILITRIDFGAPTKQHHPPRIHRGTRTDLILVNSFHKYYFYRMDTEPNMNNMDSLRSTHRMHSPHIQTRT